MLKKNENKLYLKTYLLGLLFSIFLLPLFAYAAKAYSQDVFGLFELIKDVIDDLVLWFITTAAVAWVTYKLVHLLWDPPDKEGRSKAVKGIVFAIIALMVMFTFYAISGLIAVTFGIQLAIPQFFKSQDGLSPGSGRVLRTQSIIDY